MQYREISIFCRPIIWGINALEVKYTFLSGEVEGLTQGGGMKQYLKIGVLLSALLPSEGAACFSSPDAKPLLGCMPFNFSTPLDWSSLQSMERELRKESPDIQSMAIQNQQRARFPELACYNSAALNHVGLINRLYSQMKAGIPANAFEPLPASGVRANYEPVGSHFDWDTLPKVKEFSSEFVRQYYPSLFAITREFETCMLDVAALGCASHDGNCRIFGIVWMGYLPDGSQYPVVSEPPRFDILSDNEESTDTCDNKNAFGECAGNGVFTENTESYSAFGVEEVFPSNSGPTDDQAVPLPNPSNEDPTMCRELSLNCFFQDVLLGQVLNSDYSHPLVDGMILLGADLIGVDIFPQDAAEAILGLSLGGVKSLSSSPVGETLFDAVEQELIDRIISN